MLSSALSRLQVCHRGLLINECLCRLERFHCLTEEMATQGPIMQEGTLYLKNIFFDLEENQQGQSKAPVICKTLQSQGKS